MISFRQPVIDGSSTEQSRLSGHATHLENISQIVTTLRSDQGNASPEPSVTGESTQIEHKYEGGTPQRGLQEFAHSRLPSETLILAIVTSKVHVRNDTDEPTIWSTHVSENAIGITFVSTKNLWEKQL